MQKLGLVRKNIVANFFGSFWVAIMNILFVPLYIKFLGIEAWGVIGLFTTLQAVMVIFDVGLSAAITRQFSILILSKDKKNSMSNLLRTMEIIYWIIAVIIGFFIFSISNFIAFKWVNPGHLSNQAIQNSILIMGIAIALQWPSALYSGGMIGIQEQVKLNKINIIMSTLRGVGTLMILWLFSPTIKAFFIWQIIVAGLNTVTLGIYLWKSLPKSFDKARFERGLIKDIWKFAAGMSGISILALCLTQVDKIILSKILELEKFGYYTFASLVAMSITRLFSPVFYSIYPKMTQLVAISDGDALIKFYHKSSQFMTLLIIPISLFISFFSYDIILFWTRSISTAENTYFTVSILVCGTAINGLMNTPYALQLAYGWTKLNFYTNLFALIFIAPLTYLLSIKFSINGAAFAWLLLNIGYLLVLIPIMHKKILINEKGKWYFNDIFLPFITCISILIIGKTLITVFNFNGLKLFIIALTGLTAFAGTFFILPTLRDVFLKFVQSKKSILSA